MWHYDVGLLYMVPGLPLLCFQSMQFLKINILQGSVVTLLGVVTSVITSLLQISC